MQANLANLRSAEAERALAEARDVAEALAEARADDLSPRGTRAPRRSGEGPAGWSRTARRSADKGMPRSRSVNDIDTPAEVLPARTAPLPSPQLQPQADTRGAVHPMPHLELPPPGSPTRPHRRASHEDMRGVAVFEFCALEALLMTATAELGRRQGLLSDSINVALDALRRTVTGRAVVAGAPQLDLVSHKLTQASLII